MCLGPSNGIAEVVDGVAIRDPPREDCKADGRFEISEDDFLWDSAVRMRDLLDENDHFTEFVTAPCEGHCCSAGDSAESAFAWFMQRTKCDGIVTGEMRRTHRSSLTQLFILFGRSPRVSRGQIRNQITG